MKKISILALICIALSSAIQAEPLGKRDDLNRREIPPAKRFKTDHEEGFFGSSENEDSNFFDLSYSSNSSTEQSLTPMDLENRRRNPDDESSLDTDPTDPIDLMSDEEDLAAQIGNMHLQAESENHSEDRTPHLEQISSTRVSLVLLNIYLTINR